MNKVELLRNLYNINEDEQFYASYQNAKRSQETLKEFLASLDLEKCFEKHLIIPEIKETMPPAMKDEYIFKSEDKGIKIEKHNNYSPEFFHSHTYFEVLYIYEGTCTHKIGGKEQLLRMGDLCIMSPGTEHAIYSSGHNIIINIMMSNDVIEDTFKNPTFNKNNVLSEFFINSLSVENSHSYIIFHTGNDSELKDLLIDLMLETINKYAEYDAIIVSLIGVFLAKLLRYYENTAEVNVAERRMSSIVKSIIVYIQENYRDVNLDTLSKHFNYSKEYISRLIKEEKGLSFSSFVMETRLERAAYFLRTSSLSIETIANKVGYNYVENFIRYFKKKYNQSPYRYRNQITENIFD